jgi:hypothetical protein
MVETGIVPMQRRRHKAGVDVFLEVRTVARGLVASGSGTPNRSMPEVFA